MAMDFNTDRQKGFLISLALLGISSFILLINILPFNGALRSPFSFLFDPMYFSGATIGGDLSEGISFIGEIGDLKQQYQELEKESKRKESRLAELEGIYDQYSALLEQINLGDIEQTYVQASVLGHAEDGYLHLSVGSKDGVTKGDSVVLGNIFMGTIISVEEKGSKIRLPNSDATALEVILLERIDPSDDSVSVLKENISRKKASGLVRGVDGELIVENVDANSKIRIGDTVVVSDSKVGQSLVLGTVADISDDPALSFLLLSVDPIIDYGDITNLFVAIK